MEVKGAEDNQQIHVGQARAFLAIDRLAHWLWNPVSHRDYSDRGVYGPTTTPVVLVHVQGGFAVTVPLVHVEASAGIARDREYTTREIPT